jgi:hypothetical protein
MAKKPEPYLTLREAHAAGIDDYPCGPDNPQPHQWVTAPGGGRIAEGPLAGGFDRWVHCERCDLYRCDVYGPDGQIAHREYRVLWPTYNDKPWRDTPTAREIVAALRDERAFAEYLASVPDNTMFACGSRTECPVARYLRARTRAERVQVYTNVAHWEEGDRHNACELPPLVARFVRAFDHGANGTVRAVRELWARLTAPGA